MYKQLYLALNPFSSLLGTVQRVTFQLNFFLRLNVGAITFDISLF